MTPTATWRPSLPVGAFLIGPALCQGCQAPVWFGRSTTRVQGATVIGEVRAWREWGRYAIHVHVAKPVVRRESRARHRLIDQSRAEYDRRGAA